MQTQICAALIGAALFAACLEGAYPSSLPPQPSIESLRHQVANQEIEIRTFEERLENLHSIVEGLQDQITTTSANSKDQVKSVSNQLEIKVASLETTARGLAADLQQLKNHANETTAALEICKKTLSEYDQRFKMQNQNMEHLTQAVKAVLDALQIKAEPAPSAAKGKTYKVKSGDSLGEIAKSHGISVKELMRINNMSSDKIVVGKTLKLSDEAEK